MYKAGVRAQGFDNRKVKWCTSISKKVASSEEVLFQDLNKKGRETPNINLSAARNCWKVAKKNYMKSPLTLTASTHITDMHWSGGHRHFLQSKCSWERRSQGVLWGVFQLVANTFGSGRRPSLQVDLSPLPQVIVRDSVLICHYPLELQMVGMVKRFIALQNMQHDTRLKKMQLCWPTLLPRKYPIQYR